MLIPAIAAAVIVARTVWGALLEDYATYTNCILQIYTQLYGNLDVEELLRWDYFYTATFVNVFSTIVIDSYYRIQLTSAQSDVWDWSDVFKWATPQIFQSLYQSIFPSEEGSARS